RAGRGRHCVTAFCGLQPLFELSLRGSLCGALPLRPDVRRGISLPTSLARVPADPRLPKPIEHTRPRGRLQASCLSPCGPAFSCSILFQQNCPCPWPLVWSHPNDAIGFGKQRAGTNGPEKPQRPRRLCRSDIFVTIQTGRPVYTALIFI